MVMEGPLPQSMKGGMVGPMVAGMRPILMGSVPTTTFVVEVVPLEGIPVMMGGKYVSPPPTIPQWKGY